MMEPKLSKETEDTANRNKALILREAKECFMATSVRTKRLIEVLTKCVLMLLQGEKLTTKEATDLFFHITRLFQHKNKDTSLRRLIFVGIKALCHQVENTYVVTSSLTNDASSSTGNPVIRASALRTLCYITDISALDSIEIFLREGIMDKSPEVAVAALSSLMLILSSNSRPEEARKAVKKFTNELEKCLESPISMVQYHSLSILHDMLSNNKESIETLINKAILVDQRSPMATCLLIRIITKFLNENKGEKRQSYLDFIKHHLICKSDLVEYEAAHSIINLNIIPKESLEHKSALSHLRNFLTSSKSALRFASVRSLNELNTNSNCDIRFWSVHRIGNVCKLHLLNKRFRIGDNIIGALDFSKSSITCAKYCVILQCEETQQFEVEQEFSWGLTKNDFLITIPLVNTEAPVLHCVLSFLFYIVDKNYPKTLFEDRAGTIELGPSELETKLFSCDFPIAIYT